jgi:hypothetical protein
MAVAIDHSVQQRKFFGLPAIAAPGICGHFS